MASWYDSITIVDEIAFDDGPADTPTVWTDVTAYVDHVTGFKGTTDEQTPINPSYGSVVFDNTDRRFDPDNVDGPYYGKLKPMRRYRRTVTIAAVTTTVLTGFVLSWDQDWGDRSGQATVPLVDRTRLPENAPLATSAYAAEVHADSPDHYWPAQQLVGDGADALADEVGGVALNFKTNTDLPLPGLSDDLGFPLDEGVAFTNVGSNEANQQVGKLISEDSGFGLPGAGFVNDVAALEFVVNIPASLGQNNLINVFVESGGSGSERVVQLYNSPLSVGGSGLYFGMWDIGSNVRHAASTGVWLPNGTTHVALRYSTSTVSMMFNGVTVWTGSTSAGSTTAFGRTMIISGFDGELYGDPATDSPSISHIAVYSTDPGEARFTAHYMAGKLAYGDGYGERGGARIGRVLDEIGFPSGARKLDAGDTIHGRYRPASKRALDYIREIERAEQGLFYFDDEGDAVFRSRSTLWGGAGDGVVFSDDDDDIDGGALEYVAGNPRSNAIDRIENIVSASFASVGGITRRDSTSVGDVGEAAQALSTPSLPNGRAASNLAAFRLRERKDPKTAFPAIVVHVLTSPDPSATLAALVGLELGDIVTIRRTPMSIGSQISKRAMVLGVQHEHAGSSGEWVWTIYAAPAPTQADDPDDGKYLILGDVAFGRIGDGLDSAVTEDGEAVTDGGVLVTVADGNGANRLPY